jgi:hypothetical protein
MWHAVRAGVVRIACARMCLRVLHARTLGEYVSIILHSNVSSV